MWVRSSLCCWALLLEVLQLQINSSPYFTQGSLCAQTGTVNKHCWKLVQLYHKENFSILFLLATLCLLPHTPAPRCPHLLLSPGAVTRVTSQMDTGGTGYTWITPCLRAAVSVRSLYHISLDHSNDTANFCQTQATANPNSRWRWSPLS